MSRKVAGALAGFARASTAVMKPYRRCVTRALVCERMAQAVEVAAGGKSLKFHATTARSLHDVLTLGQGEPDTVAWLDSLEPGQFWDVGANVGLYSLYAGVVRGCTVTAFEPSAASFAALAKNIEINSASEAVSPYCLALGGKTRLDRLWMECSDAGHSMHQVGRPDGKAHYQAIPVFAGRDLQVMFSLPAPRYLKVDVDGTDLAVLMGMAQLLGGVQSLLVEAETPDAQRDISNFLAGHGLARDRRFSDRESRNLIFCR